MVRHTADHRGEDGQHQPSTGALALQLGTYSMHTSSPIEPIYRTTSANKPIDLGTHRVTLLHRNRRGPSGDGALSLRLSPSPGLVCTMLLASQLPITDVITAAEIPALSTRFPTWALI